MPLFVLSETSAGYGLFKVKDKKLLERDDLNERVSTLEKINSEIQLKQFKKWESAAAAISELDKLVEGKVPPLLEKLLEGVKDEKKLSLLVADKGLGASIQKLPGYNINPVTAAPGSLAGDIFRSIREHLADLVPGIDEDGLKTMSLGLSHSLSRHKIKFSADKVDTMVTHAVSLLDDLDKEINVYAMRVKEWYGWHFPELAKILNDNLVYAKMVSIGLRDDIIKSDLSEILPEEIEIAIKAAADVSMGVDIDEADLDNIRLLAEQVINYTQYRAQLGTYIESRMKAIAPNLTEIVGFLIGARLIGHTGSLINLAKAPASTVQILGAEKALFRALKTKHATPKYGLIYNASLVGQATGRNKGKMARMVASKAAIAARNDALAEFESDDEEDDKAALGITCRAGLELRLRRMEGKPLAKIAVPGINNAPKFDLQEVRKYNINADGVALEEPAAIEEAETPAKKDKKAKKEKKEKKAKLIEEVPEVDMEDEEDDEQSTNGKTNGVKSLTEADYERLAEAAGISTSKFKRKYERGDVELDGEGNPIVHSKKELKKLKKAEKKEKKEKVEEPATNGKRKRDDDAEKPKKKKKKHHTEA